MCLKAMTLCSTLKPINTVNRIDFINGGRMGFSNAYIEL